jgi:hypothetical protein
MSLARKTNDESIVTWTSFAFDAGSGALSGWAAERVARDVSAFAVFVLGADGFGTPELGGARGTELLAGGSAEAVIVPIAGAGHPHFDGIC